ncbi:unnamed protein product, partial [Meganyctiphanes norvegica]
TMYILSNHYISSYFTNINHHNLSLSTLQLRSVLYNFLANSGTPSWVTLFFLLPAGLTAIVWIVLLTMVFRKDIFASLRSRCRASTRQLISSTSRDDDLDTLTLHTHKAFEYDLQPEMDSDDR